MPAEIYTAYSGEARDRILWAGMEGTTEEVRAAATMLYLDMRTRQEEAGNEPTGGVWIGNRAFEPTVEELEAHHVRAKAIMTSEKNLPDEVAEVALSMSEDELNELIRDVPDEDELVPDVEDGIPDDLDVGFDSELDLDL